MYLNSIVTRDTKEVERHFTAYLLCIQIGRHFESDPLTLKVTNMMSLGLPGKDFLIARKFLFNSHFASYSFNIFNYDY